MQYNPNIFTPTNNSNSLIELNRDIKENKEETLFITKINFNYIPINHPINQISINLDLNNKQMNLINITSTSIDPSFYRYFLKVPSIMKSKNSQLYEDSALRKRVSYIINNFIVD